MKISVCTSECNKYSILYELWALSAIYEKGDNFLSHKSALLGSGHLFTHSLGLVIFSTPNYQKFYSMPPHRNKTYIGDIR